MAADAKQVETTIRALCEDIGARLCGSKGEQAAADYIEGRFRELGLEGVRQEPFRFPNWHRNKSRLLVGSKRPTDEVRHASFIYSPPTPPKGITGELVYLQGGTEADLATHDLRGKVGLMIGSLSMQEEATKRRFCDSGLVGLVGVDNRIPYDWMAASGMAPQWTGGYTLPSLAVPFLTAVDLVKRLPLRVRMQLDCEHTIDTSQNVLGELVGTRWPDQAIVISAHHDCVEGNVGANDNASGCALVVELARLLSAGRPKRTIRFVTYGVEERLSVGAYVHMRLLGKRAGDVVFCLNADSVGSLVGEDVVLATGPPALERLVATHYAKAGQAVSIDRGTNIYSDHFPLNIAGAPSVWLSRPNVLGRYNWTLHSRHDNPAHVSPEAIARTADTAAGLVRAVADAGRMPFRRELPRDIAREVRRGARAAYRHPWPVRRREGLPTLLPPEEYPWT